MGREKARLRLLWSDLLGVERGKYLYGQKAEGGRANFAAATLATTLHRVILPIPGLAWDVGLGDMQAHADAASLRPGWEKDTCVGVADLFRAGKPLALDSREILRRACQPWIDRGLHPQIAFELELYLLRPDGQGRLTPLDTPGSRVYGTGTAVDPDRVIDDIVATAIGCGFPVEAWCSEFEDSQFEVNLAHRDAVAAADDAFLMRTLFHELAAARGYRATFLGKPLPGRAGNGLHVNISFRTAGGENALSDSASVSGLSPLAASCVAGMLAHHQGLAAICAPTVNAYRRLRPGMMNGYWANWGHDDRTVAIRIPPDRGAATRLEHRTPDGAANPYLAAAALLHAARFGVEAAMAPPPPQPPGEPRAETVRVPASLHEAVEAFAADALLCTAFGHDMVQAFTTLKRAEWDFHRAGASTEPVAPDRERDYYLPFF